MHLRIKYNHWYPKLLGIRGIAYYPFIFLYCSRQQALKERILHHEWIHVQQIRRDGAIYFYLRWLFEFFVHFIRYRNLSKAYRIISYEQEAYRLMYKIKLPRSFLHHF